MTCSLPTMPIPLFENVLIARQLRHLTRRSAPRAPGPDRRNIVSSSLDLVTTVATQLMEATALTAAQVSEQVLAKLVAQLDVDVCFLRHNDHDAKVSKVVAEWPPR